MIYTLSTTCFQFGGWLYFSFPAFQIKTYILMILHGEVITSYSKYSWRKILTINFQIKFRVHFCRYLYPSWLWHSSKSLCYTSLVICPGVMLMVCWPGEAADWGAHCQLDLELLICSWISLLNGFALHMDAMWKIKSKQPNTYRKGQNQLTVRAPWVHTRSYYDANEGMTYPVTSMLLKK